MKRFTVAIFIALIIMSCNKVKDKTKETLNKGGEAVGEMATEFAEGVSEGVERTLDCNIVISDRLKQKGLDRGKYYIANGEKGNNNKLTIYLITDKPLNDTLTFLVKDKKGLEFGRQQLAVTAKAGEAHYYDVLFNERTNIEVKSTIEIK
ncbi:hypothetical protein [Flavobacterium rhizosphaerae]|uniref:Lipoprotein n=1 Tax=Flavobacterium rhizosphaerae TaxID=3163298 RepID=A0ABW8YTB2_9FLAO